MIFRGPFSLQIHVFPVRFGFWMNRITCKKRITCKNMCRLTAYQLIVRSVPFCGALPASGAKTKAEAPSSSSAPPIGTLIRTDTATDCEATVLIDIQVTPNRSIDSSSIT